MTIWQFMKTTKILMLKTKSQVKNRINGKLCKILTAGNKMPPNLHLDPIPSDLRTRIVTIVGKLIRTKEVEVEEEETNKLRVCL